MPQIIKPIFETKLEEAFASTKHRFFTMTTPIQSCVYRNRAGQITKKESDFVSFVATPFIDSFLEPVFALDSLIHLVNALASAAKGMYLWSLNQQKTSSILDEESGAEFGMALSSLVLSIAADLAQALNLIISLASLITRPIMSAVQLAIDCTTDHDSYRAQI
ncbi:hypothetical protein [Legionella rowbothamii]|uniref:hypothetical protein n=1 Tax=Legionella rowbothamii TaxID=96229 RepID=UPI001054601E|nr:hypothetical protein [Legionella rowbothamii]